MAEVSEFSRKSLELLSRLYEETQKAGERDADVWKLGHELGFSAETTHHVEKFLEREGLVQSLAARDRIAITLLGVAEMVEVQRFPDVPTRHFPALTTISDRPNQEAKSKRDAFKSETATSFPSSYLTELAAAMRAFKALLSEIPASPEVKADMRSKIATIESQLASPEPEKTVIQENLGSLQQLLTSVRR